MKNKILLSLAVILLIQGLSTVAFSQEKPLTLQEAIRLGLDNNPRTQANALRLQAAFENVQAAKQSAYLPKAAIGYQQDLNDSSQRSAFLRIHLNLFNGFSDYYRIKARECGYKLTEANYNSTNARLQNTSGQIVGLVVSSYIELIRIRENIQFYTLLLNRLNEAKNYAKTDKQRNSFENFINSISVTKEESLSNLKIAESNYKAAVNQAVPSEIDSFANTLMSIKIPDTAEESFQISLDKSPEILSSKLALECQKLGHKANQANLYSAKIDLSYSHEKDYQGPTKKSNSAQLRLTIPFDVGGRTSLNAEAKEITATELDLEGAISDVQNDLNNNYINLKSSESSILSYEKINQSNEIKIQKLLSQLSNLNADQIDDLYSLLGSSQGYKSYLNMYYIQTINLKYSIQKNIGTLFETNNLSSDPRNFNFKSN